MAASRMPQRSMIRPTVYRIAPRVASEGERAVVGEHLQGHLSALPAADARSRVVLEQMKADEEQHATNAVNSGAAPLPAPVRGLMRAASKVMTIGARWI